MAATGSYVTTTLLKERIDPNAQVTWAVAETTLLDKIVAEANQWVETFTGKVLAPITYTAALFDAFGAPRGNLIDDGRALYIPYGVRSISLLEYATTTGGDFTTIASGDYFLRPLEQDRIPGMPADRIYLSDAATAPIWRWRTGHGVIRLTGTGGPAAVPDDVRRVAVRIAVRSWGASKSHADEVQTVEPDGSFNVSIDVTAEDKRTLSRYGRL